MSGALSKPGRYAFALAPASTDSDTAHFMSKEASSPLGAYLLVKTVPATGDADAGTVVTVDASVDGSRPVDPGPGMDEPWPDTGGCSVTPHPASRGGAVGFGLLLLALARRRGERHCHASRSKT